MATRSIKSVKPCDVHLYMLTYHQASIEQYLTKCIRRSVVFKI